MYDFYGVATTFFLPTRPISGGIYASRLAAKHQTPKRSRSVFGWGMYVYEYGLEMGVYNTHGTKLRKVWGAKGSDQSNKTQTQNR